MLQAQNSERKESIAYRPALEMSDEGITVLDTSFSRLLSCEVICHLQILEPHSCMMLDTRKKTR